MSWIKKRGPSLTPSPNSSNIQPVQMYNPNQHTNMQNQWQSPDLQSASSNWYSQPQQPNQKTFPSNFNQTAQQPNYWQQPTPTPPPPSSSTQFVNCSDPYQQSQATSYDNNTYQRQNHQYTYNTQAAATPQQQGVQESDGWGNWGWGDEENFNNQSAKPESTNSNPIESSFKNDQSRDWAIDESGAATNKQTQGESASYVQHGNESNLFPKVGNFAAHHHSNVHNNSPLKYEEQSINAHVPVQENVQNIEHPENVMGYQDNIPMLASATVRNIKSEHLTQQWSTESQVSQDSSDLQHTSESDKSHMLSRSSTISDSPISGHDPNVDQFSPRPLLSNTPHKSESESVSSNYYLQSDQDHNIHENREVLPTVKQPEPAPTPPVANKTPPLLPPSGFSDDSANPYKRIGTLSHKTAHKVAGDGRSKSISNPLYTMSATHFNQSVNLETLPENSEQPDGLAHQPQSSRKISTGKTPVQQWPDNNEIAPINDRNQYLETGRLSQNDYADQPLGESADTLPPPGLRRMVLGQIEQPQDSASAQGAADNSADEPPPGLSRMVLGQTGSTTPSRSYDEVNEPPVGLHRMVPGESSSPEYVSSSRSNQVFQPVQIQQSLMNEELGDEYGSEAELNQSSRSPGQVRSATIGADTPPATAPLLSAQSAGTGRSETIGAGVSLPYSSIAGDSMSLTESRHGAVGYNSGIRETNADGANNLDEDVTVASNSSRRQSIEGQPESNDMGNLINSVRDLTVGHSTPSGTPSASNMTDRATRRSSGQESSESDREQGKEKASKERRHDKHDGFDRDLRRNRHSQSPDHYRDKRHPYRNRKYEEDADYLSDKERERYRDERGKREEYDRKYSSLRRDKDKDRRRKEHRGHRDYDRDPGRSDYYNRFGSEYDNERSRPSSRSDSMNNSYRHDKGRHRNRDRDRRHWEAFNSIPQGYNYDPYNPYYQYQYYENLRRTNPQAYAELYHKYYQQGAGQQTYAGDDRASVHSGRSSANDELTKERYARHGYYSQASYHRDGYAHSLSGQYGFDDSRQYEVTDSSLGLEDMPSQRLTPTKFATAHIKASISSGRLVKLLPHYPLDGQNATVEISSLGELLNDDAEYRELTEFPGPLVKGVTHKKVVIEFCENRIRNAANCDIADLESYVLMWELLILLLRQNGTVVGTDIAELLMKNRKQELSRRPSVNSSTSSLNIESTRDNNVSHRSDVSGGSLLKEEIVTSKFRECLIYGSGKEALELAMKHGLWGHALFLASKLDKRTYANVMTRFANGLAMNDPLQTLYQLLSGKVPASVTCVADEKWGDWRPHLAMILSNTTQRPELDRKAITTLADTLQNRGSLYAAQFCYLMAQVEFSRYGNSDARLVLLGSNHHRPFLQFALNESIHMTEIYEYACSLNDPSFSIPIFQPYKYLLANRLVDVGLLEKSLAYLEQTALSILQNPSASQPSLVDAVCELGDRLKYCDPVEDPDAEGDVDTPRPDNSWLRDLKIIQRDYNMGLIRPDTASDLATTTPDLDATQVDKSVYEQSSIQCTWQQTYPEQQPLQQWPTDQYAEQQQSLDYQNQQRGQPHDAYTTGNYQEQQQFWKPQQQWNDHGVTDQYNQQEELEKYQPQTDVWNIANTEREVVEETETKDVARPQISMPNQSKGRSAFDDEGKQNDVVKHKPPLAPKQDKSASTGWFGGIWNKLSLRPRNQMKLPDDKNPTIVWDEKKKRWMNLEEDGDNTAAEVKPPPKMTDMFTKSVPTMPSSVPQGFQPNARMPQPPQGPIETAQNNAGYGQSFNQQPQPDYSNTLASSQAIPRPQHNPSPAGGVEESNPSLKGGQPNMFKLQKSRNLKKSYVDVFNPGGKPNPGAPASSPESYMSAPSGGQQMNFFVPAPVADPNAPTDFLTPISLQHAGANTQLGTYQPQ